MQMTINPVNKKKKRLALWLLLFLLLLNLTSVVKGAQTRWQSSVKGWGWVGWVGG